uniref:Rho guanine nucleotide exchange factor (GEF) 12a n=1 Tax=Pygocentrus nattereri TaxID=42514 RepID=A0AAR2JML4_PYGNA
LRMNLSGLVQRCVIIQKDESGFGLTVSGDNPVFVQLVKEDIMVKIDLFLLQVNGTLVTHSNHVEVVKLIKSGSYVALTVLGRPPGMPQIPLSEGEGEGGLLSALSSPHSPGPIAAERSSSSSTTSPSDRITSPLPAMKEEYSRNPTPKLLKEIQEAKKHIPLLQDQLSKATGAGQVWKCEKFWLCDNVMSIFTLYLSCCCGCTPPGHPESCPRKPVPKRDSMPQPKDSPRQLQFLFSVVLTHGPMLQQDSNFQSSIGSPSSRLAPQIIGAEDDDFDTEQEQVRGMNGQCSCFQSIELLKARPAHLAAFLHHVVSQFDPAPLLCYLYAELYKQSNSKDTRRLFIDLHTFFMDRTAHLKVAVPDSISADLDRRRPELIPEEIQKQYVQQLQDTLLLDIQKHLEDFRQKRSMGLTLAEAELTRLDTERVRDRVALERERSCAEQIILKIEEVLMTSPATEEEKCNTMQYVILSYMKHLGVKVKESRGLEHKPKRMNLFPKIKDKDGGAEEKVKKPRFPSILGQRYSRIDPTPGQHFKQNNMLGIFIYCLLEVSIFLNICIHLSIVIAVCVCSRMEPLSSGEVQSEDDQGAEVEQEQDPPHWQTLVSRDILALLPPHEIKRQEVINELFYTERAHLRMLKVLDNVFYQRMTREAILPPTDIKNIFTNLEEIVHLHMSITEQMTAIRKKNETAVMDLIGDDLLSWFSGAEEEKIKQAVGTFCSNQPFALELIKSRQKKDQRFASFVQEAESNRQCRRLQLKDIIPVEMQRLTKYPLLLENIAKYTEDVEEKSKVKRAGECCRKILNHVNQEVKEAENKQRLEDYQRRLDLSSLKQSELPMIAEFKNLDLTKRKMVHEGPLSWKVNKDKTIELYTLLLEDILVLTQRQDEKLILKCHSKNLAGTAETKHTFSPIIKLSTVMVRSVATDNKSFFVLSMSDNGAQIYELMAQTVSEQRTWTLLLNKELFGSQRAGVEYGYRAKLFWLTEKGQYTHLLFAANIPSRYAISLKVLSAIQIIEFRCSDHFHGHRYIKPNT